MTEKKNRAVTIVTGAARGIGRSICAELLLKGNHVVGLDRDEEALAEAERAFCAAERFVTLRCDVGNESDVEAAVLDVQQRFGSLTGLVNNAALANPENAPLERLALDDWRRVMQINLDGVFLCTKHALPHLKAARGAIVNIASTRALMSEPNTEAYAAAKGALLALTHAVAISAGPQVRVNCISPGWIETGNETELSEEDHAQHPVGRVGRPEDVAQLCAFLLSSEAGFITGQNYIIDGGMTRKMIYQ